MLSYRHSFHAGNHADVLKHIVQLLILRALKEKEKGFLYLDTHSGVGRYSLLSFESEKTGEYLEGVAVYGSVMIYRKKWHSILMS